MPQRVGPVVLSVTGDEFVEGANISLVLWVGQGAAGDTAQLHGRNGSSSTLLWEGRAVGTNIYEGVGLDQGEGHAPDGFKLTQISSGKVLVYLRAPHA